MQLINRTPFAGAVFVDMNPQGADTLVLALKATYEFGGSDSVRLSPRQDPLVFHDLHAGEPGGSSLLYESDANWGRQMTDVSLLAYAYPGRDGDRETDVALRVGDLVKTARVFGHRAWSTVLGIARMSAPQPFERIPLTYEHAFGGTDASPQEPGQRESEPRNPVGKGLRARKSRRSLESLPIPHVEDPENLIDGVDARPAPVGFTPVAKAWTPRSGYAGTYDEAWQAARMPLLPQDFDPRFYTAASPGLSMPYAQGGEPLDLIHLTPSRRERFALPRFDMQASFLVDAVPTPFEMRLDAIVVNAVTSRLQLVWHGHHPIQGLVDDVRWAMVEGGEVP